MDEQQIGELIAGQQLQSQMGMNAMNAQQQMQFSEMQLGLAAEQLDLKKIIIDIFKTLTGKEIIIDPATGDYNWIDPVDQNLGTQLKVLSKYGVQKIMEKVIFYINKRVMLSSYKEDEINRIMYDFTTCLNDFVLMRYEGFFYEPTLEECMDILKRKIEYREKIRAFAEETLGFVADKTQIKKEVLEQYEGKIELEIERIKEYELEKRINEYDSITMEIEHQVLNTYKRAEGGMERSSLRKHSQYSEVRALSPEQKKQGGMFQWLKS